MASDQQVLTLLFERPAEPLIIPKGEFGSIDFKLPSNFLSKRYRLLKSKIKERFDADNTQQVEVKNVILPDITVPLQISRTENFSLFIPKHREIASKLVDIFMKVETVSDLVSVAAYCRDRLNPYLFNYSLSVAILHRSDTKDIILPNFLLSFPGKFIDSSKVSLLRKEAITIPSDLREPIVIPREFTASSREPEQRLAYFREDIGINLHHWHWHLVYPFMAEDRSIVDKDRRGELFYYMHEQILARYDAERLSNNLDRVKSYTDFSTDVSEAYFPKLQQQNSSRSWPPRFAKMKLSDIDRPKNYLQIKVEDLQTWRRNIEAAIKNRYVVNSEGVIIPLTEQDGINILGNIVESSILTPNSELYGDLHNMGHVILALCHDPEDKYLEGFSVLGDSSTAMRDPVFYRWHSSINDLLISFKNKLLYYKRSQLDFKNIRIMDFTASVPNKKTNELSTFWEQSNIDLSHGLDFVPRGPLFVRITHLQHDPIVFTLKIKNTTSSQLRGTARLFVGPKFDSKGRAFTFDEQRLLMIELDKFMVTLLPGDNTILRKSEDSSVTIPYDMTFRSMEVNQNDPLALRKYNFCGCGWPDHMLIPKGTPDGFRVQLFAMITDYEKDKIDQEPADTCTGAESYCGLSNRLYPDRRPMGYPFDRKPKNDIKTIEEFLTPNMIVKDGVITHSNVTRNRETPVPKPSVYVFNTLHSTKGTQSN